MESQVTVHASDVIYWLIGGFLFITQTFVGWFIKSLFEEIRNLKSKDEKLTDKVSELAEALPSSYVSKTEHTKALDDIFNALRRIEDKLDKKVDKP